MPNHHHRIMRITQVSKQTEFDQVNYNTQIYTHTSAVQSTADLVCPTSFVKIRLNTQHSIAGYLDGTQYSFIVLC